MECKKARLYQAADIIAISTPCGHSQMQVELDTDENLKHQPSVEIVSLLLANRVSRSREI